MGAANRSPEHVPEPAPSAASPTGKFEFGSYGRVVIASDGRGGTGRQANIVAHGDRIDEDSYAELELRREDTWSDRISSKVVTTLALFPPFFHFSGDLSQSIVVRNLYAQGTYDNLTLWVGSRMYRGDDIYLLDWWPLDNQNTLGGGAGLTFGDTRIAAHVGMNRLDDPLYYEQITATAPLGFGTTTVTVLDRPRIIETLKATRLFRQPNSKAGFKAVLYGEVHELSAGLYTDTTLNTEKPLPSDSGFMVGGELAYFTGERDTFVQFYAREARGLAAYDPLSAPVTFAADNTTGGANETLFAVGGNYEREWFGLLFGGYLRFFRDGSPSPTSTQKYDEGVLALRPQVFVGEHWGVALDGSYQAKRLGILDQATNAPYVASEWRAGLIPYFSPSGRGSYKRPQIRAIFNTTFRDSGARGLYATQDVFSQRSVEYFVGLGAEWWFNSSSYP